MFSILFFAAFLWTVRGQGGWEPCGSPSGCECSLPVLHHIHCRNITVFPLFDDFIKPGVLALTVDDSNIAGLPPFRKDQWDRLRDVTFMSTPLLSCDSIAELRRPGLHVLSECLCPAAAPERSACSHGSTCLASLLVLVILVVGGLGFLLYGLRRRRNSQHT